MKVRESNYELLRILCILGILTMHVFGLFNQNATGMNLIYGVFINTIFNACVSIFVLISGYFGIKASKEKIIFLELTLLFYSLLSYMIVYFTDGTLELKELIKSFLPFSTGKYWYMTSYMLLMIFAEYINKVPERLKKDEFRNLIFVMAFVFSILPTFLQAHVMDDGGKGIANMLLMYFVGRYLRLYPNEFFPKLRKGTLICVLIVIGFLLNYAVTWIGGNQGVRAPFARDCSVIIILLAISVFEMFGNIKLKSELINRLAKHVIAIYLLEAAVRGWLVKILDFGQYGQEWYLPLLIFVLVLSIALICIIIDIVKVLLLDTAQKKISNLISRALDELEGKAKSTIKN